MPPTKDDTTQPDPATFLAQMQDLYDRMTGHVQTVTAAVATVGDHADRAENAANAAVAAAPTAAVPAGPYVGAIVNVSTKDQIDGQNVHAAIVTAVHSADEISASVFRAIEGAPIALQHLVHSDDAEPEGDSWHWPQVPA